MSALRALAGLLGVALAMPVAACELDGINHGIFGAWGSGARLSVLVKQHEDAAAEADAAAAIEPVADADVTEVAAPTASGATPPPPAPRRNFAAWARPRITPSPEGAAAAQPAGWARGAAASRGN